MPTDAPPKSGSSSGFDLSRKIGPLPVWGWIAVAVVGIYLYRRYTAGSGTSSSTTSSSTGTPTAVTEPTETITTPSGSYTGPADNVPYSVLTGGTTATTSTGSTATTTPTTTPGTTSTATPGSGSGVPGYGEQTVAGQQFITLGTTGPGGAFSGYNVGGGAPVYFLTPGSTTPEVNLTPQAVQALPGGTQVLTPAGYAGAVQGAPTQETIG